jgi:hypothetical protein
MNHYRKVPAAEWSAWARLPADLADQLPERPMSAQDLLDRGMVVLGADGGFVYVAVAHQGSPRPGQYPGWAITDPHSDAGRLDRRHRRLPPSAKPHVERAVVWRAGNKDISRVFIADIKAHVADRARRRMPSQFTAHEVPLHEVRPTDAVEVEHRPAVVWAGEEPG